MYQLGPNEKNYSRVPDQPETKVMEIQTSENILWLGTEEGLYYYRNKKFVQVDSQFTQYIQPLDSMAIIYGNESKIKKWDSYHGSTTLKKSAIPKKMKIYPGCPVLVYISTDSVYSYDQQKNKLIPIFATGQWSPIEVKNHIPGFLDQQNGFWCFEDTSLKFKGYLSLPTYPQQILIHQRLRTLVVNNKYELGIYRINENPSPLLNLDLPQINHIYSNNGNAIISTNQGIITFDIEHSELSEHELFRNQSVNLSFHDRDGNWWYGLDRGLLVVQKKQRKGIHLKSLFVYQLDQDQEGHIWALTNRGVSVYDHHSWHHLSVTKGELPTPFIRTLMIDKKGRIWIGSEKFGLLEIVYNSSDGIVSEGFTFKSYTYKGNRTNPYQSNTTNQIVGWRDELILGNYSSGILRFNPNTHVFYPYLFLDETPMHNIRSMVIGPDSCLWFSSIDGFFKLNLETNKYKRIRLPSPSEFSFISGAAIRLDSHILFGTDAGVLCYDTAHFNSTNTLIPKVHFHRIYINGNELKNDFSSPITLNHYENNIKVHYGVVDYLESQSTLYQYWLEGIHSNWQQAGSQKNLYFASIPPGEYLFKVKASGADYQWNEEFESFAFIIHPPFWKTWLFRLILVGLGITIIGAYIRNRINARNREIVISEKIRGKAAADFHDEMGNRIARLSLFAEILEKTMINPSSDSTLYLKRIQSTATDIHHVMRDFLWALDPQKDRATDLAILIKDFGEELFSGSGIVFRSNPIPEEFEEIVLTLDKKRHGLMIFKEAMTNVMKHAEARNVYLSFGVEDAEFKIKLRDDGQGFVIPEQNKGLGLDNMKRRATNIDSKLKLERNETGGTSVILFCKI